MVRRLGAARLHPLAYFVRELFDAPVGTFPDLPMILPPFRMVQSSPTKHAVYAILHRLYHPTCILFLPTSPRPNFSRGSCPTPGRSVEIQRFISWLFFLISRQSAMSNDEPHPQSPPFGPTALHHTLDRLWLLMSEESARDDKESKQGQALINFR